MLPEPDVCSWQDKASGYKMRVGGIMFIIYAIVYAGFVVINICIPLLMEKTVFLGLNLASAYGFGLIIFALILALIYNVMCAKEEAAVKAIEQEKGNV